jgi:hypothetical protein
MDRRERDHKWYSSFNEKRMVFVVENGEGDEIEIPAEYEVCGTCEGKGSHVNPSIDSHGLTREDFDEDPDFAESYMRGDYDQPCNECGGQRVAPRVADRATAEEKQIAEDSINSQIEYEEMCAAERRMGA